METQTPPETTALAEIHGEELVLEPRRLFSIVPSNMTEAMEFAKIIAESDLAPKDFRGKPGNVLVAVQMGAELGLAPMQALQNIAVVNGRPSVWGDAALALVKASGLLEYIEEKVENDVARCRVKRRGEPNEVVRTFSKLDAETAKLWDKDSPWRTHPARMLQMRARAFALRDVFPDVLKGVSVREEVRDFVEIPPTEFREIAMPRRASDGPPPAGPSEPSKAADGFLPIDQPENANGAPLCFCKKPADLWKKGNIWYCAKKQGDPDKCNFSQRAN